MLWAEFVPPQRLLFDNFRSATSTSRVFQNFTELLVELLQAGYQQTSQIKLKALGPICVAAVVNLGQGLQADGSFPGGTLPGPKKLDYMLLYFIEGLVPVEHP
jgi:hypothetical protein